MPLQRRSLPFDDPDWLFELKYDGYRSLAVIEHGRAQLLSRNGHPFASFSALAESISDCLPNVRAVLDGEICSLDRRGRPQFKNLMFHPGNPPCFDGHGMALFQRVCELDLEGIVAKQKFGPLRHRARAQYVVQDSESGIFTDAGSGRTV